MTNDWLTSWLDTNEDELVEVRRHIHAHPELGFAEFATTDFLVERLTAAGLRPRVLPRGTGAVVDIGEGPRTVVLRGDIDALPLPDLKNVPYRSTVPGVCHACGHDVHATIALGAALALATAPELPGRVRVIFQPAEEAMTGAREVIAAGEFEGVERAFALHCDPRLPAGKVGVRTGAITAACDTIEVRLTGPGGHTARPHLTVDLIDTLARIATDTPAILSRLVDPRAGFSLVWGAIEAGTVANAIPADGTLRGTMRVLDHTHWSDAEKHVRAIVADIAAASGAKVEIHYERGVPPVINDRWCVDLLSAAVVAGLGRDDALVTTETSMGGEDFAWYGEHAPVTLARLGVHSGDEQAPVRDLHRGDFDIDERALALGVRVLVGTALTALATGH